MPSADGRKNREKNCMFAFFLECLVSMVFLVLSWNVCMCVCVWSLPHVMKWLGIQLVNLSNDLDLRGRSWYAGHVCNACLIYRSFDPTSENQIYTLILWSVWESEASKYLKLCIPKFPAYDMRAMSANLVCFSSGLPDITSFCHDWGFGKTRLSG